MMQQSIERGPAIAHGRPPRVPTTIRDAPADLGDVVDWSGWILTDEEDMGQSPHQALCIDCFSSAVGQLLRRRADTRRWVGSDAFFAWLQEQPLVRVSPDVYLLADHPPVPLPASFQTWRDGHEPPVLAVEMVSEDWKKDYEVNPEKYDLLGARELVVFDADAVGPDIGPRTPLQVFRRTNDALFVRRYQGKGPAYCETLDAWLVVVPTHVGPVLRIALDAEGADLVPTAEEAAVQAEQERDAERAAREELERKLAELQARLGEPPDDES